MSFATSSVKTDKLSLLTEVGEPDDVVPGLGALDARDGGDDLDEQPLSEEGARLSVDLDELGLDVALGQDGEVLVHDLAAEGLVPVEVDQDLRRVFGRVEELLLLGDLGVLSVALVQPVGLLLLGLLQGFQASNLRGRYASLSEEALC